MKKRLLVGCITIMSAVFGFGQAARPQTQPATPAPAAAQRTPASTAAAGAAAQRAVLDQYCVVCHNDKLKTDNFSLEKLDLTTAGDNPELWEKVVRKLRAGVMPPPGMRRPPLAEYEGLRDWLETEIDRKAATHQNPGSVVLHRLNRTEYANVIHDLLDLDVDVSSLLPADDSARGFDNVAGSLTISSTLLEAYTTAATSIARMAVGYWKTPSEQSYFARADSSQTGQLDGMPFGTRGGIMVKHTFPADGEYTFEIQNFGLGRFIPGEQLELLIDGERVHLFDYAGVGLTQGMSGDGDGSLSVNVAVRAGSHTVGATFLQTNLRPSVDAVKQYERKTLENNSITQLQYYPVIGLLRIKGPFNPTRQTDSKSIRKIFTCRPANPAQEEPCAKQILSTLTRRAYRRAETAQDLESLMTFYADGKKSGGTFEDGIELALRRLLASPQFLVRAEKEPVNLTTGQTYRISDQELASRLSFFLWSSIPDDELIRVADQKRLSNPAVLEQQARRMLADPRSKSLVENFGQQFLFLRNLPETSPDGKFYPNWDDELRKGFQKEMELLFESIIKEDRNVVDLLTADYTFVNERLARHYGIPGIYGSDFRRVTLGPDMDYRRGLLGKGTFLSITWVQNFRTSPVKRGVWVLENILGTEPPQPPPNVPPLEDSTAGSTKVMTLREQMTLHRKNEPCASCHKLMDPIGFALENFDADGSWRVKMGGDGGSAIDPSAELWDGTKVNGPVELRNAVLHYSPQFVRMFTEKLMTFALGRGTEYYDMPVIRQIVRDADKNKDKFSSILMGVIKSPQFQMRAKSDESTNN